MANNIYIGVSNKARKVTKAYVGISGKARKIKKAYIGVGGKAHLFYTTEVIKSFSSNIFPTTWTDSSDYTSATGSNTYGTWKIYTDNVMYDSSGYKVSNAFDNNDSTVHRLMLALEGALRYVEIYLPSGVTICPSRFSMTYKLIASNYTDRADSYIQGRTTGGYWVNLVEIPPLYEEDTKTLSVSTSSYYTAFRFGCARYSDDERYGSIAEIKLTRGSIKYST